MKSAALFSCAAAWALAGCNSEAPVSTSPPLAPTIDCFGTPCSDTCCLIGDAGSCESDAAACVSCIALDAPADAASDGDATSDADAGCLPVANTFQCFSAADCPDSPPPPDDWFAGPIACCVGGLFGVSSGCARTGLFGCGLLATSTCTSNADCTSGTCRPLVVNGVKVPMTICQ